MNQRIIKFRAWDGRYMYGGFGHTKAFSDAPGKLLVGIDGNGTVMPVEGITLMQFTGLKDKNGKEIYEGDILKDDRRQYGQVLWAHNSYLVEWDERDYQGHRQYQKMTDDCFGYGEVIGNIYENPELLNP